MGIRVFIAIALVCGGAFFSAAAPAAEGFPPDAARAAYAHDRTMPPGPDETVNGLAQDCLTALGADGDATDTARAGALAAAIISRMDPDGGWGLNADETFHECAGPGTMPGLTPGPCDPADTADMYHTGLAMACLARYGAKTGDAAAISAARKAADQSWSMGSNDTPCPGCFTYWPTYSANDANRFVRNRSVLMGMGLAWLSRATHDQRYADRAAAIARAEHFEISQGNAGYFSVADPAFRLKPAVESQRIENHAGLVAKGLLDIGRILGDTQAIRDADTVIGQWVSCTNAWCQTRPCGYWAGDPARCRGPESLLSCLMRKTSKPAAAHCARAVAAKKEWGDFTLWYLYDE